MEMTKRDFYLAACQTIQAATAFMAKEELIEKLAPITAPALGVSGTRRDACRKTELSELLEETIWPLIDLLDQYLSGNDNRMRMMMTILSEYGKVTVTDTKTGKVTVYSDPALFFDEVLSAESSDIFTFINPADDILG